MATLKQAKPIPEGFHTVTPYLVVDNAEKVIAFTQNAFGAELLSEADEAAGRHDPARHAQDR